MDLDAIKAALYTWFKREAGLTEVIFPRQGKPRPKLPYGIVDFLDGAARVGGSDELRRNEDDDGFELTGLRTAVVTLDIYGVGANSTMSRVRDSIGRPDVIEEMNAAGFSVWSETTPTDLTEIEDTKYPERSQMELTISYAVTRETTVVEVEQVEVTQAGIPGGDDTFVVEDES